MAMPMRKRSLLGLLQKLQTAIEALPDDDVPNENKRMEIRAVSSRISAAVTSPQESLAKLRNQPHQSAAAMIAIQGGWFEALADGTPKTAKELASTTGAQEMLIIRIMRVLTATDIVLETGPETYKATPISQLLTKPAALNGLKHFFDHGGPVLLRLPQYLAGNSYQVPDDPETAPFADTWGSISWKLFEKEPARGEIFNSFMTENVDLPTSWLDFYPFETRLGHNLDPDGVLFVDIGGGYGHVLQDFKAKYPHLPGRLIVQDLSGAISKVEASLKKEGIEPMIHDFFTPQPIKGARVYHLSRILHDWPNAHCLRILRNTRQAMKKGYSRILINELVLPEVGGTEYEAFIDLSMMVLETGQERTKREWEVLFGEAGLRLEGIWGVEGGDGRCVIEAVVED